MAEPSARGLEPGNLALATSAAARPTDDDDDARSRFEAGAGTQQPTSPGGGSTMSAMHREMERRIREAARERELEAFSAEEKFCGTCGKKIPRISERLRCRACFSRESGAILRMKARARLERESCPA